MTLIARNSLNQDYTCLKDWPSDTFVQCGGRGIVFGKDGRNYRTAFFEAFPKNPSTFIRGEGASVEEAEAKAFEKYERIINCDEHDMQRRGNTETGICSKCNLSLINHLKPVFNCHQCGKEGVNYHFHKEAYCQEHFIEQALKLKEKFNLSFLEEFLLIESDESLIGIERMFSETKKDEHPEYDVLDDKFSYEQALFTSIALKNLTASNLPEHTEHHRLSDLELKFSRHLTEKCNKFLKLTHEAEIKEFEYFFLPDIQSYLCFKPELYEQLLLEFLGKPTEEYTKEFCEISEFIWQKIYAQDLKDTRSPEYLAKKD